MSELHSHAKLKGKRIHAPSRGCKNRRGIRAYLIVDREVPFYYGIRRHGVENVRCCKPVEPRPLEAALEAQVEVGAGWVLPVTPLFEKDCLPFDASEKLVVE